MHFPLITFVSFRRTNFAIRRSVFRTVRWIRSYGLLLVEHFSCRSVLWELQRTIDALPQSDCQIERCVGDKFLLIVRRWCYIQDRVFAVNWFEVRRILGIPHCRRDHNSQPNYFGLWYSYWRIYFLTGCATFRDTREGLLSIVFVWNLVWSYD